MNKKYKRELAIEIVIWFWFANCYLRAESWTFAVNKTGKYLPGTEPHQPPPPFVHRDGDWHLLFHCDPWNHGSRRRKPHMAEEVQEVLDALHIGVSAALHNLVGSANANKLLADMRRRFDLRTLRAKDIFGDE